MIRIQRSREANWRKPPNFKYVGRPTQWGNPLRVGDHLPDGTLVTEANLLVLYDRHVTACLSEDPHWLDPLFGYDLACWCNLDRSCHVDVLIYRCILAERNALIAVLQSVQQMTTEDIRLDRLASQCLTWSVEAEARAVLQRFGHPFAE